MLMKQVMYEREREASGRWTIGKQSVFNSNGKELECEIGSNAPKIEENELILCHANNNFNIHGGYSIHIMNRSHK